MTDLIRANRELVPNEIDVSDLQSEKHGDPRSSTLVAVTID
jgi:hypothetical protein